MQSAHTRLRGELAGELNDRPVANINKDLGEKYHEGP
jgi:hypothetical protein